MNMRPQHVFAVGIMLDGVGRRILIAGFKNGHELGKHIDSQGLRPAVILICYGFQSFN